MSSAFPIEERLRKMERHKKRKNVGLDKFATKREQVVEQHFDDCGEDLSSIVDVTTLYCQSTLMDDSLTQRPSQTRSQTWRTVMSTFLFRLAFSGQMWLLSSGLSASGRMRRPIWLSSCPCWRRSSRTGASTYLSYVEVRRE